MKLVENPFETELENNCPWIWKYGYELHNKALDLLYAHSDNDPEEFIDGLDSDSDRVSWPASLFLTESTMCQAEGIKRGESF